LGEKGATAADRGGKVVNVGGKKVEVVDTVGSGDAFTAGFVHSLLAGGSLEESCRFGNELGAAVAGTRGGMAAVQVKFPGEPLKGGTTSL
jgi:sugar/nucleoside kinase (ribokinase family)